MDEKTKEKIIIAVSVVGVGAALAVAILLLQERADTRTAPPGTTGLPGTDPIMRTSLDDAATGNASRTTGSKPATGSKGVVGSSRSAPTPAPQTRQAEAARVDPERPAGGGGSWFDNLLNFGSAAGKNNDTTGGLWS